MHLFLFATLLLGYARAIPVESLQIGAKVLNLTFDESNVSLAKRLRPLDQALADLHLTRDDGMEYNAFIRGRAMSMLNITREHAVDGKRDSKQQMRLDQAIRSLGGLEVTQFDKTTWVLGVIYASLCQLDSELSTRWTTRRKASKAEKAQWAEDPAENYRYFLVDGEPVDLGIVRTRLSGEIGMPPEYIEVADQIVLDTVLKHSHTALLEQLKVLFIQGKLGINPGRPTETSPAIVMVKAQARHVVRAQLAAIRKEAIRLVEDRDYSLSESGLRNWTRISIIQSRIKQLIAMIEARWRFDCAGYLSSYPKLDPIVGVLAKWGGQYGFTITLQALMSRFTDSGIASWITGSIGPGAFDLISNGTKGLIEKAVRGGDDSLIGKKRVALFRKFVTPEVDVLAIEKAARLLGIDQTNLAFKLKAQADASATKSFVEKTDGYEQLIIGELLDAVINPQNKINPETGADYFKHYKYFEWAQGRPLKDRLIAHVLDSLHMVGPTRPVWQAHNHLKALELQTRATLTAVPVPKRILSGQKSTEKIKGIKAMMAERERLVHLLPFIYLGLRRLLDLPYTPLVEVAMETLLEIENHATLRDINPRTNPASYRHLFKLTPSGIKMIPIEDTVKRKALFTHWLNQESSAWTREIDLDRTKDLVLKTPWRSFVENEVLKARSDATSPGVDDSLEPQAP